MCCVKKCRNSLPVLDLHCFQPVRTEIHAQSAKELQITIDELAVSISQFEGHSHAFNITI